MIPGFEKIVEERILMAQREGAFENLPDRGRPLELSDDQHVAEDLRLAFKILKNADCLPPEVALKKEISQTRELLAAMPETAQKYQALKKLNYLIFKFNNVRNGAVPFEMPEAYSESLTARFAGENRASDETIH